MLDVHSALGICGLVALGLAALLHGIRQRKRRRDAHLYEIPPFLRGTGDPGASADSSLKTDWLEIHPAPGRRRTRN